MIHQRALAYALLDIAALLRWDEPRELMADTGWPEEEVRKLSAMIIEAQSDIDSGTLEDVES